jgi:hypothetical protein
VAKNAGRNRVEFAKPGGRGSAAVFN